MTDITELALRLKLEVLRAVSDFNPQMNIKTRDLKALVEALEKAQQRIDDLENDEVRQRLANAEHQLYMAELAKNNLRASRKAQFRKRKAAEQRIAELESRTVKLPKPISVLHRREFTAAHCAIYAYPEAEVNAALDGSGIKWEAE
ncbi:Uncharacterised protein [Klebsiella pneumoniae]|uniref:ead/Ea22-like family protein n=1 Tax=Klebsiella pneumoniae TaxID=573 RepID=UPI000E2DCAAA|nr:ead/Ea22-like family protein [Klebsiella pneumoniae]VVK75622.1 Uncharacterised protein [Klebsiella pneumoniae]